MSSPVVVTVRRSGGVTGITRNWSVDSATLSPADAAELRRLAGDLPRGSAGPSQPDAFQYEVDIAGDDARHSVTVNRASAGRLLDFVASRDPLQ